MGALKGITVLAKPAPGRSVAVQVESPDPDPIARRIPPPGYRA